MRNKKTNAKLIIEQMNFNNLTDISIDVNLYTLLTYYISLLCEEFESNTIL